jgi:hypothetical protein
MRRIALALARIIHECSVGLRFARRKRPMNAPKRSLTASISGSKRPKNRVPLIHQQNSTS